MSQSIACQEDIQYKAMLKFLGCYCSDIAHALQEDNVLDNEREDLQAALILQYPAIKNLFHELRVHYKMQLPPIPETFSTELDKANALIKPLDVLFDKLENNPHFRNVPLSPNLRSKKFPEHLEKMQSYVNSLEEDDNSQSKAAYWSYHGAYAAYDYGTILRAEMRDKIVDCIYNQELYSSLLPYIPSSGEEDVDAETLTAIIADGLMLQYEEKETLFESVVAIFEDEEINVNNPDFIHDLKKIMPQLNVVSAIFLPDAQNYDEIDDRLNDFMEEASLLTHEDIFEIINSQRPQVDIDINQLTFSQEEMDDILQKENYIPLLKQERQDFAEYNQDYPSLTAYENTNINDAEIKDFFIAKYKEWVGLTAESAESNQMLAYEMMNNPQYDREDAALLLESAQDILLIGEISGAFLKTTKEKNSYPIKLDDSGTKHEYIDNLLANRDRIEKKDFRNLGMIFAMYKFAYQEYAADIAPSAKELDILNNNQELKYLQNLEDSPESLERYQYTQYLSRAFRKEAQVRNIDLQTLVQGFRDEARKIYAPERQNFEANLEDGAKFYPSIIKANRNDFLLSQTDLVIDTTILMPLYLGQRYKSEDFFASLPSVVEKNEDKKSRDFVVSSVVGYRNALLKKFKDPNRDHRSDNILSLLALSFNEGSEVYQKSEYIYQKLQESLEYQQPLYDKLQKFRYYQKNLHPDNNHISQLILNSSVER